jgi:hypothetical protein
MKLFKKKPKFLFKSLGFQFPELIKKVQNIPCFRSDYNAIYS